MSKYEVYENQWNEFCVIFKGGHMPSGDLGFDTKQKADKMIDWFNNNPDANMIEMDNKAKELNERYK